MNFIQAVAAARRVPAPSPGGIVTAGLVFHIDPTNPASYPGSGTTIYDLAGTNNGTFEGGVYVDASGHLRLDGVNDAVRIGTISTASPLAVGGISSSVQAWGYNAGGGESFQAIYAQHDSAATNRLMLYRSMATDTARASVGIPPTTYVVPTGGAMPLNSWHLLTQVTDVAAGEIRLYVQEFFADSLAIPSALAVMTRTLRIGSRGTSSGANEWRGRIGAVMQYNRVLTPSEILQNFNATKASYGL